VRPTTVIGALFRRYELVLGLLIATAFWLLVFALASNEKSVAKYVKDPNTTIALAALITAALTYRLFANARDQLMHNRKVERAYVKISHPSPGIDQLDANGVWLTVGIKNYGRTPARVTDVVLKPVVVIHGDPLPTAPDYTGQHQGPKPQAFLVTEDEFRVSRFYPISANDMSKVKAFQSDLYIIGYVDYVDQFDQAHRGGYARQYQPNRDRRNQYKTDEEFARRNNLTVVAQDGYNYDHEVNGQ
jgi:hypothetical protein